MTRRHKPHSKTLTSPTSETGESAGPQVGDISTTTPDVKPSAPPKTPWVREVDGFIITDPVAP